MQKENAKARFGLSSPRDLLDKLRHDLERLRVAEAESGGKLVIFAAMDCAVTIVAIRDWTKRACKDRGLKPPNFYARCPNFRLAVEVANGLKHYVVDRTPLEHMVTGSVFITRSGGKPVKLPHFLWIGHFDKTMTARNTFDRIADGLEGILSEVGF